MAEHSQAERDALRASYPDEFKDGARGAFGQYDGPREPGGYPAGFHSWPIGRRNSWFAGYNAGRQDRLQHEAEHANG